MALKILRGIAVVGLVGTLGGAVGCNERQQEVARENARQAGKEVGEAAKDVGAATRKAAKNVNEAANEAAEGYREGVGGAGNADGSATPGPSRPVEEAPRER